MDLVAPTSHSDHLIHRMLSVLPKRQYPSDDIHIDMKYIFPSAVRPKNTEIQIETGRLLELQGFELVVSLIGLKHKEALIELRKKFLDVVTNEDIPVNVSSMVCTRLKPIPIS